ncbi:YecA family protein [Shewanella frigidimarina]|uniref:YecA family protein n=1 Tax=Shewanella frigidimarina TaxID=56812 RepID=UPI003D79760D
MKLGRNEPCWCGSSRKYKHCHLGREKQSPVDKGTIKKELNSFNSKKYCSVPESQKTDCSKKIIKAHSVSKSSSLKAIAVDGHVYSTFKTNHDFSSSKRVRPKKVGINQASVFTGFCSNHDKQIFAPIEDYAFDTSDVHCFLVAYRSLCRELFVKESVANTFSFARELDKGKALSEQIMIQKMAKYYGSNNDLTMGDLRYLKQKLDNMFLCKEYGDLHHFVIELESPPKAMTSAVVGYTVGFDGELLQTISNDPKNIPDYVFINSFSSDGRGYTVLSWLEEHSVSNLKFLKQLQSTESISNSLSTFTFAMVENIYLSPLWWESLNESQQEKVCEIYAQGAMEHTKNTVLMDVPILDDNPLIHVTIVGRFTL